MFAVEEDKHTSFKVYVMVYGPPTPAALGLKFPEGETPGPLQLPPVTSADNALVPAETQT